MRTPPALARRTASARGHAAQPHARSGAVQRTACAHPRRRCTCHHCRTPDHGQRRRAHRGCRQRRNIARHERTDDAIGPPRPHGRLAAARPDGRHRQPRSRPDPLPRRRADLAATRIPLSHRPVRLQRSETARLLQSAARYPACHFRRHRQEESRRLPAGHTHRHHRHSWHRIPGTGNPLRAQLPARPAGWPERCRQPRPRLRLQRRRRHRPGGRPRHLGGLGHLASAAHHPPSGHQRTAHAATEG